MAGTLGLLGKGPVDTQADLIEENMGRLIIISPSFWWGMEDIASNSTVTRGEFAQLFKLRGGQEENWGWF